MTSKRKSQLNDAEHTYQKRNKTANLGDEDDVNLLTSANAAQPQVDPTYGQRGAFPGLEDNGDEDDLFYGPASDGLEYLRMVRSEARTVPNLLVAPPQTPSGNQEAASSEKQVRGIQGYYADGTYVAVASFLPPCTTPNGHTLASGSGVAEDRDPQEIYYEALRARFIVLRGQLRLPPPLNTHNDHSATLMLASLDEASNAKLHYTILYTAPSMKILARMQQESIMRCLRYTERLLQKKNVLREGSGKNLGAWCWGLLAQCREVGEMTSEDVSVLRQLGKKAVILGRKLRSQGQEDEEEDEDEPQEEHEDEKEGEEPMGERELDDEPNDLELAKQKLLQKLHPPVDHGLDCEDESSAFRASSTLDVIITIVGMMYGQRDLLDARAAW